MHLPLLSLAFFLRSMQCVNRYFSRLCMRWIRLFLTFLTLSTGSQCLAMPNRLTPCPSSPNCVCSCDPDHKSYTPPFPLLPNGMEILKRIIKDQPRSKIVEATDMYIHAEFHSKLFKFIDDLEFLVNPEKNVIEVSSRAREGYWDLGVNRRRVETLRKLYLEEK